MLKKLRRLSGDNNGNIAVTTAIASSAILLCVGAAVDLTNNGNIQSKLSNSVDIAVIAAATSEQVKKKDLKKQARASFDENYDYSRGQSLKSFVVTKPAKDRVRVEAVLTYEPYFGKLFGKPKRDMIVSAESLLQQSNSLDVALVLDRTGSMAGTNLSNLKAATEDFLDDIEAKNADVRVSVIPFSDYVNIGLNYASEEWLDLPTNNSSGADVECSMENVSNSTCPNPYNPPQNCQVGSTTETTNDGTTERTTTRTVVENNDGSCTTTTRVEERTANSSSTSMSSTTTSGSSSQVSSNWSNVSQTNNGNYCTFSSDPDESSGSLIEECSVTNIVGNWYGCVGSRSGTSNLVADFNGRKIPPAMEMTCGQPITPLTTDMDAVRDKIDSLTASGMTYMPAGLMWGWRSLEPAAPLVNTSSGDRQKLIILMTDGANTVSQSGLFHTGQDWRAANTQTENLCEKVKAANVSIATVSYSRGARDSKTTKLLQECASGSELYFEARNAQTLKKAFEDALKSSENIRLVN